MSWLPSEVQSLAEPDEEFLAADCPTRLDGINSIAFTIRGTWEELRLVFQELRTGAQPFHYIGRDGTYTLDAVDAEVPGWWDDPNAGVNGSPNVLAIQFVVASQTYDEDFEFCVSNITVN